MAKGERLKIRSYNAINLNRIVKIDEKKYRVIDNTAFIEVTLEEVTLEEVEEV